jgi:hypothetical protein
MASSLMSRVSSNIAMIVDVLEEYEEGLNGIEAVFDLENRRLEQLCKEHSQNLVKYDTKLQELKSLQDFIKIKIDEIESRVWKKYNEGYSLKLSTRDIQAYIAGDSEFVAMREVELEIANTRRKYEAVVEGLKNLGWQLSHITKLRVAQIEDAII